MSYCQKTALMRGPRLRCSLPKAAASKTTLSVLTLLHPYPHYNLTPAQPHPCMASPPHDLTRALASSSCGLTPAPSSPPLYPKLLLQPQCCVASANHTLPGPWCLIGGAKPEQCNCCILRCNCNCSLTHIGPTRNLQQTNSFYPSNADRDPDTEAQSCPSQHSSLNKCHKYLPCSPNQLQRLLSRGGKSVPRSDCQASPVLSCML